MFIKSLKLKNNKTRMIFSEIFLKSTFCTNHRIKDLALEISLRNHEKMICTEFGVYKELQFTGIQKF